MTKNRILDFVTLVLVLPLLFVLPLHTSAEETATSFQLYLGENNVDINEDIEVIVENGDLQSSIIINKSGKQVYENQVELMKISTIYQSTWNGQDYLVIEHRYDGSANALYFEILALENDNTRVIYQSDVYEKARIQLDSNGITVENPIFLPDDSKSDPTKFATQQFTVNGSQVNSEVVKVEDFESNKLPFELNAENGKNLTAKEMNKLLTELALDNDVSPEVVKAIALQESSWQQYWTTVPDRIKACEADGRKLAWDGTNVKLGYDCIGIGIMQVSNHMYLPEGPAKDAYIERLKTDIPFNIQEGIDILKDKWNYKNSKDKNGKPLIPTINGGDPLVIENWYFAIMAYNGILARNNPLEKPFAPYGAYQEEVIQSMINYSEIPITPFPTHKLDPYEENGLLRFTTDEFILDGPMHKTPHLIEKGHTAYVTAPSLNLRKAPNGESIGSVKKGDKVTVTGDYVGNNSIYKHYVWVPVRTSNGVNGYVASSYLTAAADYVKQYNLNGYSRYDTSVSVANYGWHWDQPSSVVIGRGDVTIDALTGSVLASSMDSPLLLTQNSILTDIVKKELKRLKPSKIYILGGSEFAVSDKVKKELENLVGASNVIRVAGQSRYDTAYQVAKEVAKNSNVKEIFITTGDENSTDTLAIAPYAGENNIPILLTGSNKLDKNIVNFIRENGVQKATIIGGELAVSKKVETEINNLVGSENVNRVYGQNRFKTSLAVMDEYYSNADGKVSVDNLFIAQGFDQADGLSTAPLASKLDSPILLTQSNKVPTEVKSWLNTKLITKPNLYFLGGNTVISKQVRSEFVNIVK